MQNKKTTIIAVSIILLITAGVSYFYLTRSQKNNIAIQNNKQTDTNPSSQENQSQPQSQTENVDIVENAIDTTDWQIYKNEEYKNVDSLVWYVIPEMGIRFKTTSDSKDDLKYVYRNYQEFSVIYLYSKSTKDFLDQNSSIKRLNLESYSELSINKINKQVNDAYSKEQGKPICRPSEVVKIINSDIFCKPSPQASIFDSKVQRKKYLETVTDKKFGVYIDSMEEL
jgi:hypothetical protein